MVHLIRTNWQGTSGGPGLTQLAVDFADGSFGAMTAAQATAATGAVRGFWDAIKGCLPNELTLTVLPVVDNYSAVTGELVGSVQAGTPATPVLGTNAAAYAMAAGLKINLNTATIQHGRRVRGSIFLVPAAGCFSVTGTADAAWKTTINNAGAAMMNALSASGLQLKVWSRPIPVGKPKGPRSGSTSLVVGMETNEKTAILRGRRD